MNVILIHAAFADPSSWHKIVPPLQHAGHKVITPELPLTSLSDDAAALRLAIAGVDGPVMLAAHSYGGAAMTAGAAGENKVHALIYIAAMAPAAGETVAGLLHRAAPHPMAPQLAPDGAGMIWMSQDGFTNALAPDSTADEIAEMVRTQKPISVAAISEAMGSPAWSERPSWYLLAEKDRVIAPETQQFFVHRMTASVTALPVDHTPISSAPEAVVKVILEAACSFV